MASSLHVGAVAGARLHRMAPTAVEEDHLAPLMGVRVEGHPVTCVQATPHDGAATAPARGRVLGHRQILAV